MYMYIDIPQTHTCCWLLSSYLPSAGNQCGDISRYSYYIFPSTSPSIPRLAALAGFHPVYHHFLFDFFWAKSHLRIVKSCCTNPHLMTSFPSQLHYVSVK